MESVGTNTKQIFRIGKGFDVKDLDGNVIARIEILVGDDGNKINVYKFGNVEVRVYETVQ